MKCLVNETPFGRWQALSHAALPAMQQCWSYGISANAVGSKVLRLEVREGGRTIALAQVLRRRLVVPFSLINRGPVWLDDPNDDQRARALAAIRRPLNGPLLITPSDASNCEALRRLGLKAVKPSLTLAMLTLDDGMRARMQGKWRNRLVAAERSGLWLRRSSKAEDLRWLFEADARQQRARRYRALPVAFTEAWACHDRDSVECVTAMKGGERLASMLFLRHGNTATYHIGWNGQTGRAASAHNLILWNACTRLAARGVRLLDLGLVDAETAPGLARFKLGTGARPVRTGGTWLSCW